MKSVDLPNLRNVVLAGHAGSGKTTLAEHLLHTAGATSRLGKVDDGTSTLDFEPEEQKRRFSLSLATCSLEHDGHRVTLLDTPGYADFVGEVVSGFAAADGALIVMDASSGIEAGLETAVTLGRRTGTAALFVLTRCDRENADPTAALDALRSAFGTKIAPLHVAIGKGDGFRGYVDLVHRKAYAYEKGQRQEVPIPEELAAEVGRRRDQLLEAAAEADDDVLTKYLEGEEVSDAELEACLHKGVRERILAPVFVSSAARDVGVPGILDAIVTYLPSPVEGQGSTAVDGSGKEETLPADPNGPLVVRAFKTAADPFVGRLTYFRVHSGTLRSHDHAWNPNRREEERIGQVLAIQGKDQDAVGEIRAGEIGGVAKLVHTQTGDTLTSKERPYTLPDLPFPQPNLPMAVDPESKADLDKLSTALARLQEEDRTVRVERQPETGEQVLWAQGDNHFAVITERLKRKFGAAILTRAPRVPYRETIRGRTQVEGRHKKQTGGHGQFGHVWLEIEPNPGGGVAFAQRVVGGVVPRQYFAGVEKGVREVAAKGPLAGYPVVDFKATLYDGSYHTVDSDELSFRLASAMATRRGIQEADPVLLEPIMDVEVRVPEAFMGDVNRDLNSRRGRVLGMESGGDDTQVVRAHVPQAELFSYATELRSLTGGRGMFKAALDHYEEVPGHVAQRVISAHEKEAEPAGR
ncbi:MAG TPA: elongation factor G [Candidatus Limnocylindrales bacterium]|nr:elongation factor G [Candidatus Limnocylindrales bacterium]